MIQQAEYLQFKAYARQYGAVMGLIWIVSFACFVGAVSIPAMSFCFDFSIILIPFLAAFFVRLYRDGIIGGSISFRRAFGYSAFIFFYATLILAIAQWVYFQYLDHGMIVGTMVQNINKPEFEEVLKLNGISKKEIEDNLQMLAETRPIDIVFAFIWLNMLAGLIISWIVALFSKRGKKVS